MIVLGLAVAGAVGAVSRFLLDRHVQRVGGRWPRGTFVVNISGSFVLGLVTGAALYHGLPNTPRVLLGTGFCGAYTTFSTYTYESVRLLEQGDAGIALVNVFGSLVAGTMAAAWGLAISAVL